MQTKLGEDRVKLSVGKLLSDNSLKCKKQCGNGKRKYAVNIQWLGVRDI